MKRVFRSWGLSRGPAKRPFADGLQLFCQYFPFPKELFLPISAYPPFLFICGGLLPIFQIVLCRGGKAFDRDSINF
nr:hypothetical protein [Bacillaceae bacterium]